MENIVNAEFMQSLKKRLTPPEGILAWSEMVFGQSRIGAVLVPLIIDHDRLMIMFVRRQAFLRRHPGEIAFPGGQKDPCDLSPIDTALRETEEETGIIPDDIFVAGAMEREYTVGSDFGVVPVIGIVRQPYPPALKLEEQEIKEVLFFDLLKQFDNPEWKTFVSRGKEHYYPVYRMGNKTVIWGLTGRILHKLKDYSHKEEYYESHR